MRPIFLITISLLLVACAQQNQTHSGQSNIEVYGEIDGGVGVQTIRH